VRAVSVAAAALQAAGHAVIPWNPSKDDGLDTRGAAILFYSLMGADGGLASFKSGLEGEALHSNYATLNTLASIPDFFRPLLGALLRGALGWTRAADLLEGARARSTMEYWDLCRRREEFKRSLIDVLEARGFAAVLCPAMGIPAFLHGQSRDLTPPCSPCFFWNLVGFPAVVLPCTRQEEGEGAYSAPPGQRGDVFETEAKRAVAGACGMPVGVQLAGLPFLDEALLGVARVLEGCLRGVAPVGVPEDVLQATLLKLKRVPGS